MIRVGKRYDLRSVLQKEVYLLILNDEEGGCVMFGSTVESEVEEYRQLILPILEISEESTSIIPLSSWQKKEEEKCEYKIEEVVNES